MPQGGIQKGGRKELIVSVDFANVAESIVEEEEEMVTDIASDETLFKIPNTERKSARKSTEMAKMSRDVMIPNAVRSMILAVKYWMVAMLMTAEGGQQRTVREIRRPKKLVSELESQSEDGFETT